MPRISAATNAAQRENTKRAILDSFGQLLYRQGLTGLTMTHVAKNAGVGRTAVYNYFADMGELLVAYALDETERFMADLRRDLEGVENPVDRLAVYIRAQIEDLTRRHLPPGPTMRTVLSPEDYQKLGEHVGELQGLLAAILRAAIEERWLPGGDIAELASLVHGSLTAAADRGQSADQDRAERERHIRTTVRFIQQGLGAQFDAEGRPVRLAPERPPLSAAS
ncbi:TetR/AcrR family transcriptional regulator [Kocuria flava]|uniref:TetR/AcrR family transcriptional regulator n=1 Tax=Kocuria flava TaxID=446860 RepID=UPI001FF2460F|nr:TetR/AcrR family transcriptional regulator [Kocuria flava]MCJ8504137.1 TetR/AcrR family transcriptional regulator [Kocuria flava]